MDLIWLVDRSGLAFLQKLRKKFVYIFMSDRAMLVDLQSKYRK